MNILVIGGLTIDLVGGSTERIGGPAYYITATLVQLDEAPVVITNSCKLLEVLRHPYMYERVFAPRNDGLFVFEIRENSGFRELRLVERGPNINYLIEELISAWVRNDTRFDAAIVSPVFNEVTPEIVGRLNSIADRVIIDIQGFVRRCGGRYCTVVTDEEQFYELLEALGSSVNVVRGEIHEFPRRCRGSKVSECVNGVFDVIQTCGPGSMYVYLGESGKTFVLNPLPGINGSSIGAGDIFTSVLAYFLSRGLDLLSSCARASVAAGLKVSRPGKPWFTLPELELLSHKILRNIRS